MDDPAGEAFPWKPKEIDEILKGVKLVNNAKEEKNFEDLAGKVVGFYFSAHWVCMLSQAFLVQSTFRTVSTVYIVHIHLCAMPTVHDVHCYYIIEKYNECKLFP